MSKDNYSYMKLKKKRKNPLCIVNIQHQLCDLEVHKIIKVYEEIIQTGHPLSMQG